MSASPGFMESLLGSLAPWMTGGSPSALDNANAQYGGTQGLLDAMMQAGNPNSSAAQFGKALEGQQDSALNRAGKRQSLAQTSMGLNFASALMPLRMELMRQRLGQMGLGSPPNASSAAPAPSMTSGGSPASAPAGGAPGVPPAPVIGGFSPRPSAPDPQGAPAPQQPGLLSSPASGGAYQNASDDLGDAQLESLLGMPGAQTDLDVAKTRLQYDPAVANQLAVAKNQISQDQAQLYDAYKSGNPALIQGLQTKLKTDLGQLHIGSMSGILTRQLPNGSWTTTDPRTGLMTNTVTGSSLMPGAAGAQRAMAAAHALGEAAGETNDVGGVPVPRLSVLGGAGATPPSKPGAPTIPGGNPFLKLLGQGRYTSDTAGQSAELGKTYQQAADAARQTNYNLDQMIADAKTASLGPAAGAKAWMDKQAAGIAQMFGVKTDTTQLNSYQELDKYANQVAFTATRAMGSREAAQIVHMQMESNPNKSLTPAAFADLAGSMKAMNNYVIAKNLAVQQAAQQNGGNLQMASAQWTRSIDPRVWDLTLSPAMGEKWAASIGRNNIEAAWPYLTADEQQALVSNIPMSVRQQWLK